MCYFNSTCEWSGSDKSAMWSEWVSPCIRETWKVFEKDRKRVSVKGWREREIVWKEKDRKSDGYRERWKVTLEREKMRKRERWMHFNTPVVCRFEVPYIYLSIRQ